MEVRTLSPTAVSFKIKRYVYLSAIATRAWSLLTAASHLQGYATNTGYVAWPMSRIVSQHVLLMCSLCRLCIGARTSCLFSSCDPSRPAADDKWVFIIGLRKCCNCIEFSYTPCMISLPHAALPLFPSFFSFLFFPFFSLSS